MQDFDEEQLKGIHMGRLIQVLSHQMKRKSCVNSMINDDGLTTMQKHVLKFLLLETLHKVVYQKDIEEEFQIRKSTATGMLQLLEKNGFIVELDFFILSEVCRMIQRRLQEKRHCVPISINQSRVLLQEKDYVKRVADILKKYDTPPRYIELELTERIFRDDLTDLAKMMGELRNLGIRWSIDDFGTGYSSLNLLKELPVDIIKIDKSFLDETESSETSKIIIRKTVELTQELDKTVVCEGVETENQADYLRGIRCDMAQGYLYAKPMPMEEFEKLLDKEIYG